MWLIKEGFSQKKQFEEFHTKYSGMNTALLLSRSWTFISQLEEFLTQGSGALVSTPSTLGGVVEKLYIGG